MTLDAREGFWKLQRAFNYLMPNRPVDTSALRQIALAQRAVIENLAFTRQVPMFELITHRNEIWR